MASVSNSTLCNLTVEPHHEFKRHRCETELDMEAANRYGVNAGVFVIVVILFYGTSVFLLIASHIKREHKCSLEDKQINSYLKEFQVVQERSSKDNYRKMKQSMIANLSKMGMFQEEYSRAMVVCLNSTVPPAASIALPPFAHNGHLIGDTGYTHRTILNPIKECEENNVTIAHGDLNLGCCHYPCQMTADCDANVVREANSNRAKVHKVSKKAPAGRQTRGRTFVRPPAGRPDLPQKTNNQSDFLGIKECISSI